MKYGKQIAASTRIICFLFVVFFLMLSYHARISGDDFFYLWLKNSFGAWKGMVYQYENWSGRWSAHFIGCWLVTFGLHKTFMLMINAVTGFMVISAFFFLLTYLEKRFSIRTSNEEKSAMSILLMTGFFFASYSKGETWFWFIIILTYLWSIIAFILTIPLIFSGKKKVEEFIFIGLLTSYIGGASESYALIFLALLFSAFFSRIFIQRKSLRDPANVKLIFGITLLLISFAFSYFAPGTEIRHSLLPQSTLDEKLIIGLKSIAKYFVRFIPGKLPYLLLFSVPWAAFGYRYFNKKYPASLLMRFMRNGTVIFILILFLMFLPTVFILSESGPDRALSVISLATVLYFALMFAIAGALIERKNVWNFRWMVILNCASCCLLIYHFYTQFTIASGFSNAYSQRMKLIEAERFAGRTAVLKVDPLPQEGMLYNDELSVDTGYFTNKHLRAGLNLPFAISLNSR